MAPNKREETMTTGFHRRHILAGAAGLAGGLAMPAVLRAQATVIRWGELLAATHPQVQMVQRISADVKAKTNGRIDIQVFPGGQLGSGKDMMESVSAGALQFTTDGAGALGAFLPALTLVEAPYLWRDAAHLAKVATPIAFPELYLALSQGAVDGQENPLPTIQSGKFFEVQKFLVLTEHIITPRMIIVNDAFWKGLPGADRSLLQAAFDEGAAWQDKELLSQEAGLVDTLKKAGMTVVEPDLEAWRKPVLATVPAKFESRWGKGSFEALKAL